MSWTNLAGPQVFGEVFLGEAMSSGRIFEIVVVGAATEPILEKLLPASRLRGATHLGFRRFCGRSKGCLLSGGHIVIVVVVVVGFSVARLDDAGCCGTDCAWRQFC